jgi:hypothetical protein
MFRVVSSKPRDFASSVGVTSRMRGIKPSYADMKKGSD